MQNTLALFSSARPQGNTFQLLTSLQQDHPLDIIDLDEVDLEGYDYQHRYRNDHFEQIIQRMCQAEHIILASPVYWYAVTPMMKTFIDRLTDLTEIPRLKTMGKALRSKQFYLLCTSGHARPPGAFTSMIADTLAYFGWSYSGMLHVDCKQGFDASRHHKTIRKFSSQLGNGQQANPKTRLLQHSMGWMGFCK